MNRSLSIGALVLALGALLCGCRAAGDGFRAAGDTSGEAAPVVRESVPPPARGARRLTLDPETGALSPRSQGGGGGSRLFDRSAVGLSEEVLANGLVKVDLRGRFRAALVVRVDPRTGEIEQDCIETYDPPRGERGGGSR